MIGPMKQRIPINQNQSLHALILARFIPYVMWCYNQTMAVIYTKHAKEMLFIRDINKKLANECATNPDKILPGNDGKKIYLKDFGVNFLKLVVSENGKKKVVITVHWLAKRRVKY